MYLWRPCLAEPPLCRFHELETIYTLDHLADFHEALDLKEAIAARSREEAERERKKR